jgi:hypothetical protein
VEIEHGPEHLLDTDNRCAIESEPSGYFSILIVTLLSIILSQQWDKRCPVCGWKTTGSENVCPSDATSLSNTGSERRY